MYPWLLVVIAVVAPAAPAEGSEVRGAEGCVACLPCLVDGSACGAVHSVVWRRRDARVLVVDARRNRSHVVAEPQRIDACEDGRGRRWGLRLRGLRPRDAGRYRCEVTFVRPHDACPLRAETRLSVTPLRVTDASEGRRLEADDVVGPLRVGDVLALDCEGPGASWWSRGRSLAVATLRAEVTDRHRGQELRCGCDAAGGVAVRLNVVEAAPESDTPRALIVASKTYPAASVTWFRDARVVTRGRCATVVTHGGVLVTFGVPARRHFRGATLSWTARNRASRRPDASPTADTRVTYRPARATPLRGAAENLRCLTSESVRPPVSAFGWICDARRLCAAMPWPSVHVPRATRGVHRCRAVDAVGTGAASGPVLPEPREAPLMLRVSRRELRLQEGENFPPEAPRCDARGLPQPAVLWRRQGDASVTTVGDALSLPSPVTRRDAGVYECEASNSLGVATASVFVTVLYAPECSVYPRGRRLRCCARGNPPQMSISWTLSGSPLASNCSHVEADTPGEYVCHPRNSVGAGRPCRATVTEGGAGAEAETSLLLALGAFASVAALSAGRRRLRRTCSCECGCGGGFTRCSCFHGEAAKNDVDPH